MSCDSQNDCLRQLLVSFQDLIKKLDNIERRIASIESASGIRIDSNNKVHLPADYTFGIFILTLLMAVIQIYRCIPTRFWNCLEDWIYQLIRRRRRNRTQQTSLGALPLLTHPPGFNSETMRLSPNYHSVSENPSESEHGSCILQPSGHATSVINDVIQEQNNAGLTFRHTGEDQQSNC